MLRIVRPFVRIAANASSATLLFAASSAACSSTTTPASDAAATETSEPACQVAETGTACSAGPPCDAVLAARVDLVRRCVFPRTLTACYVRHSGVEAINTCNVSVATGDRYWCRTDELTIAPGFRQCTDAEWNEVRPYSDVPCP